MAAYAGASDNMNWPTLSQAGQLERAVTLWTQLVALNPQGWQAWQRLAETAPQVGRTDLHQQALQALQGHSLMLLFL